MAGIVNGDGRSARLSARTVMTLASVMMLTGACGVMPPAECPAGTPAVMNVAYVAQLNAREWLPSGYGFYTASLVKAYLAKECCSLKKVTAKSQGISSNIFTLPSDRIEYSFWSIEPIHGKPGMVYTVAADVNRCGKFLFTYAESTKDMRKKNKK